ncbi:MAG: YciI family protein [Myxococcales bacterium]|nr:YciI family protein [Myxococcales bacterium]
MQYLLLIYEDETVAKDMSEEQNKDLMERYFAFTREVREAGALLGGDALHPVASATTVRVRGGRTTTTDGPFAETKEQLGGYYLIDVPDLDAALAWAAKIPASETGSIEVRPVMIFET